MKIAICDDDEKCTDNVLRHLDYYSLRNNTEFDKYVFSSADKLLKSRVKFDIAVLDVEMQEQDGIKLGAELRKRLPHLILIYITAHRKYLDDALNLNAVRFLKNRWIRRDFTVDSPTHSSV